MLKEKLEAKYIEGELRGLKYDYKTYGVDNTDVSAKLWSKLATLIIP